MTSFRKTISSLEKSFDHVKLMIKDALNLFDPVIIYPYLGYGTEKEIFIEGRVLEKEDMIHEEKNQKNTLLNNIRKIWKRYKSNEIPGVEIVAEFEGIKTKTHSDEDGFFKVTVRIPSGIKISDGWHDVKLHITGMPYDLEFMKTADAPVLICNQQHCFGVISDVDDTIIESSALNTWKKLRIMFTKNARNRVAFEGVETLYQKLHAEGKNPLFFVSGSSWNLYDMLISYSRHKNIPRAPFFLRNLGLTHDKWFKKDTSPYKKQYIKHILEVFNLMSFIFIGDSGQKDPEIYSQISTEYPNRVIAIYIRHIQNEKRKKELEELAGKLDIPFLLFHNSGEVLEHASTMKWI
jgi:phosphatidate phosphatase APP1